MANQETLKFLKENVEDWNKWREQNLNAPIDLSDASLFEVNLSGVNLGGGDYLSKPNLSKANLGKANLSRANLSHAILHHTILRRTDLSEANLMVATLKEADLFEANLQGANLSGCDLSKAKLEGTDLRNADLSGVDLTEANLTGANLTGANLSRATLFNANLSRANFFEANLQHAILCRADFDEANLSRADLSKANLIYSHLVKTNVNQAKISGCLVYAVNVWDLEGEFEDQNELIITHPSESAITVDNIKVAQFIYLILKNKEIRDVINTLTSKTVLILGRFALPERKIILDTLRNKLREYNLLPVVFDFERPTDKDFTETIKTLAGISYFVIADVTNPKSSPLELQATVPDYQIPFVPIVQKGESPFSMMADLQNKYNWVLDTVSYDSLDTLVKILKPLIIDPAVKKRDELRIIKAKLPTIISGKDSLNKE